ncbi:hypothetical protein O2N63_17130 [Aliiroseovarius sp. KMU-50]|uniref:Uncharacterized protein n=1 Tax=Aliiroseovarius salicola TaxID=3009082 RepID=A0ABT4W5N0_9RHOB|nr:hypothetical protein [Aliiroseovarius sp. KMU-50]MDA5095816.1 hypothetical protein [Aliiroseovarius sp. KMU-50]
MEHVAQKNRKLKATRNKSKSIVSRMARIPSVVPSKRDGWIL